MTSTFQPFQFLLVALAGWLNRHQEHVIDYLLEENRILKAQLKGHPLRFTDDQRRRLAVRAKLLGRACLQRIATLDMEDAERLARQPRLNLSAIDPLTSPAPVCRPRHSCRWTPCRPRSTIRPPWIVVTRSLTAAGRPLIGDSGPFEIARSRELTNNTDVSCWPPRADR